MSDLHKDVLRAWAELVAQGAWSHPISIARRTGFDVDVVARTMGELRAKGMVPNGG